MIKPRGLPAAGSTIPACRDAMFHLAEPFAIFCADVADVCTEPADAVVELAFVSEHVGGHGAYGGAVQHQADVLRAYVFAADFEAMSHHHGEAGRMAARERIHALMHLVAEAVGNIRHRK